MDFYTFCLLLGGAGLAAMGAAGFAHHSSAPGAGHSIGHGHAGGAPGAAAHGQFGALRLLSHGSLRAGSSSALHALSAARSSRLLAVVSPRVWFGILLGLGTAGVLLTPILGGRLRFLAALAAGLMFDRLLLTPLWNFSLRFASRPALSLEMAVSGEAIAVTSFDSNGQGIVRIELDGQVVQVLATLTAPARALRHRVRAGEALRIEDVDAERNRCHVSLI